MFEPPLTSDSIVANMRRDAPLRELAAVVSSLQKTLGEVQMKGEWFPGHHEPLMTPEVFSAATRAG